MSLNTDSPAYGRRLTNEGPTVIGMLTSVMESGGSLDSAIRYVADEGPDLSRDLFSKACMMVDLRLSSDIRGSMMDAISSLPETAKGYCRSLTVFIVGASSPDGKESDRLYKESADVALDAVRLMGEWYSASLNSPSMIVFGIGIMIPMLLMSMIPLLGMSGMFDIAWMNELVISVITLIVVPSILLAVCLWIRESNPFGNGDRIDTSRLIPLLVAIPLCVFNYVVSGNTVEMIVLGIAPAIVLALLLDIGNRRKEIGRHRSERALKGCFQDMGNRMLNGANYENSLIDALSSIPDCKHLSGKLSDMLSISHRDVPDTVMRCISVISDECSRSMRDICLCSYRDNKDAGKLAMSIGRQYANRMYVSDGLDVRLKGTTDMMYATAAVFAPLVLGMSISMMGPLTDLVGVSGMNNTGTVLSIYLIELCAIVSMFISSIRIDRVHGQGLWGFCTMVPVSLLVFTLCSAISL